MPRPKASATGGSEARTAILDAAERIFGLEGYNGAVIRDIATAADVNLGLIQYHFGSKDRLFSTAVDRRFAAWKARIEASLAEARALPGATPRDVIRAFIRPFLEVLAGDDAGWIAYLRLVGRGMSAWSDNKVHPALTRLSQIPDLLKTSLAEMAPVNDPVALDLASYVLEVTLTFIVQDRGLMAARTGRAVDTATALARIDTLAGCLAAGFADSALATTA